MSGHGNVASKKTDITHVRDPSRSLASHQQSYCVMHMFQDNEPERRQKAEAGRVEDSQKEIWVKFT
jgi:hypothetical protein